MSKKQTIYGLEYPSLAALCRDFKVSYAKITQRLRAGLTLEQAVAGPAPKVPAIPEAECCAAGVNQSTAWSRVRSGASREDALTPGDKRYHLVEVEGVVFASKKAACAAYDVKPTTVCRRVNRGMTFADALLAHRRPRQTPDGKELTVNGTRYTSIGDAAEAHGLTYNTVYARLLRLAALPGDPHGVFREVEVAA